MNELNQTEVMENHILSRIEPSIPDMLHTYLSYIQKAIYGEGLPNKEEMEEIILTASHFGGLIRETYYNFVYKGPCNKQQFWNALISTFVMTGYWRQFQEGNVTKSILESGPYQEIIEHMSYPKWVELGLTGAGWSKIRRMCKKYCKMRDINNGTEVKIKRGKDKGEIAEVIGKSENKVKLKIGDRTKELSPTSITV